MLLDEHFEAVREKFNGNLRRNSNPNPDPTPTQHRPQPEPEPEPLPGILRRNTDNLNRWVTTDLRYIDAESKTAAQVLTSTTHVLVLTCLAPCLLTCLLTLLTHLLRAYSLAHSRTHVLPCR